MSNMELSLSLFLSPDPSWTSSFLFGLCAGAELESAGHECTPSQNILLLSTVVLGASLLYVTVLRQ